MGETMEIKTTRAAVRLGDLVQSNEVRRIAEDDRPEEKWALNPVDCDHLPIVRRVEATNENGYARYSIVDGCHRLAGMIVYGAAQFPVIIVDAPIDALRSIDAEAEIGACDMLDAIYAADGESHAS